MAELLAGKGIDMPPIRQVSKTFKKAPRAKGKEAQIGSLPFDQQERRGGDGATRGRKS